MTTFKSSEILFQDKNGFHHFASQNYFHFFFTDKSLSVRFLEGSDIPKIILSIDMIPEAIIFRFVNFRITLKLSYNHQSFETNLDITAHSILYEMREGQTRLGIIRASPGLLIKSTRLGFTCWFRFSSRNENVLTWKLTSSKH